MDFEPAGCGKFVAQTNGAAPRPRKAKLYQLEKQHCCNLPHKLPLDHECQIKRKRRRRWPMVSSVLFEEKVPEMKQTSPYSSKTHSSPSSGRLETPRIKRSTTISSSARLMLVPIALVALSLLEPVQHLQASQQHGVSAGAGLQQAMAQMLQVFNGNDSNQLEANHFKVLKIYGDSLLVGARNFVFNLSLTTMHEQMRIEWPSSSNDVQMCRVKGKTTEQCQNYIKVIELEAPNTLHVCGTNAYKPMCRRYTIGPNSYIQGDEFSGEGICPYQETQNVTSIFVDGQLYTATTAQFSGMDGLIHRYKMRTEQFNPRQLNSPNFVTSFRYGDYVYFLFREIAIEHINCGKTIYSRIARICITDNGGPTRSSRERWTSFTKARLNCSLPGEFPFAFDEIQSSTHVVSSAYSHAAPLAPNGQPQPQFGSPASQDLLYAVFTTPQNSIGGSAVCAYRMSDVLAAFDGPFKSQLDGSNSNWLPVAESRVPQVPVRPGRCVNDTRRLPDDLVNFIKENPLMDRAVEPVWSQPLVTMASINFRFTQIAVDAQVETQNALGARQMRTDVIFVATDDGRVFKLINTYHLYVQRSSAMSPLAAARVAPASLVQAPAPLQPQQQQTIREPVVDVSASTIVIEELHLFDSRTPVVALLLHSPTNTWSGGEPGPGKLLVASAKQIKAIPLSRCERATTCADCLALYDPYCAWDTQSQLCLGSGRSVALDASQLAGANEVLAQRRVVGWFQPNNNQLNGNNHTLAWWEPSCPAAEGPPPSVGAPLKSMFSSHLQVPSRYDYASGHHLSRAPLLFQAPVLMPGSQVQQAARQAVSECMTFCGAGSGVVPVPQMFDSTQSPMPSACADYFSQQSLAVMQQQQQRGVFPIGTTGQFAAENLNYSTVITCVLCTLLLGLLLGFAFGRRSAARALCGGAPGSASGKHHGDSSVCSSTFDETNLYMASTGSHQAALAHHLHQATLPPNQHLFAGQPLMRQQQQQQHPLISYQQASGSDSNAYSSASGNQQLLLQLANADQQRHKSGARTGAPLPPLPQQQPLVSTTNGPTTHINHSQLTPPTSSSGASSNTSNSAAQMQAEQQQQMYLNQHQLLLAANQSAPAQAKLHQRSFSGAAQQQQPPLAPNQTNSNAAYQQQARNKIYL